MMLSYNLCLILMRKYYKEHLDIPGYTYLRMAKSYFLSKKVTWFYTKQFFFQVKNKMDIISMTLSRPSKKIDLLTANVAGSMYSLQPFSCLTQCFVQIVCSVTF